MLSLGDSVDRFTIEALIGSGGTAIVYRVRHHQLGTAHALKVLSVSSDVIRERMLTEGRVQAAMQHRNIVAVTDVLTVDDAPGLLMEYIDGPSLDRALQKYRIDLSASEALFLGIVAGVREAHNYGLVHRDLKPANVLLARTSDGFVPKVTDFGLAKVLAEAHDPAGHTRSGVALGTPAYMAPEQIRDARGVDQRADLFALGCILYELATKRRAFPGDDTIAIYNHVLEGRIIPPRALVADLPDRIDNAIRGCLVPDREARIPDTETLLRVLRGELLWEVPELPPAPDLPPPPAPGEGSGPDLPLSTLGAGGESLVDPPREEDPLWASIPGFRLPSPPTPPAARRRRSGWVILLGALLAFFLVLGVAGAAALVLAVSWLEADLRGVEGPSVAVAQTEQPVISDSVEPSDTAPVAETAAPAGSAEVAEPPPAATPDTAPSRPTPSPSAPAPVEVKILSAPPTASFRIDGVQHGRTPAKLWLPPGDHAVEIQSGDRVGAFTIEVVAERDNMWCYSFGSDEAWSGSCLRQGG